MNVKNYILIGIIIIAIGGFYISQNLQEPQTDMGQYSKNQGERILEVQLEVSAPYSTAKLLVSSQGTIDYEAEAPSTKIEKYADSKKITEQQFNELAGLIVENNFWAYNKSYFEDNLFDATTYILNVKSVSDYQPELADAKVYSVSCYGRCPEKIIEIINMVRELWNKDILEFVL